jgi:hypothetical protein
MKNRKPRSLTIGTAVYFWKVHHCHEPASAGGLRRCAEVFSAFFEGFRQSPVRVLFPESDQHGPGYVSQRGVVVDYKAPTWRLNLNRPRSARLLIEVAELAGWSPGESRQEFIIHDGYELLREHRARLDCVLNSEVSERTDDT